MPLDLADASVVIESPQAGVVTSAILEGCNSVLGVGRCVARGGESQQAPTSYTAELTRVDSEGLIVRISLYRGRKNPQSDLERTLVYSAKDLEGPRERATGIVIAAQVLSQLRTGDSDAAAATPAATKVATTTQPPLEAAVTPQQPVDVDARPSGPVSPPSPLSLAWGFDALLALERGPDRYRPLLGARAGGWVMPSALGWRGQLTFRYAHTSADFTLHRFGGAVGVAFSHPRLGWLEPRAAFIALVNRFGAESDSPYRSESQVDFRYGLGLGLELSIPLSRALSLLAGSELTWLTPTYDLAVAGKASGSEGHLGYDATLGLRWGRR